VALAEFVLALLEQLYERAVDVAEAEEAEVVSMNACPRAGLKPGQFKTLTQL
jgi:hypothetical protein